MWFSNLTLNKTRPYLLPAKRSFLVSLPTIWFPSVFVCLTRSLKTVTHSWTEGSREGLLVRLFFFYIPYHTQHANIDFTVSKWMYCMCYVWFTPELVFMNMNLSCIMNSLMKWPQLTMHYRSRVEGFDYIVWCIFSVSRKNKWKY